MSESPCQKQDRSSLGECLDLLQYHVCEGFELLCKAKLTFQPQVASDMMGVLAL